MEASQRGSLPRADSTSAVIIMSVKDLMDAIESEQDDTVALKIFTDWEASRRLSSTDSDYCATPGSDSDMVSLSSTSRVASGRHAVPAESNVFSLPLNRESEEDGRATYAKPPSLVEFGPGNTQKKPAMGRCFFRQESATPGGDSDTISLSSTSTVASVRHATPRESLALSLPLGKESEGEITATYAKPPSLVEFGPGEIRKRPPTRRCFFRVPDAPTKPTLEDKAADPPKVQKPSASRKEVSEGRRDFGRRRVASSPALTYHLPPEPTLEDDWDSDSSTESVSVPAYLQYNLRQTILFGEFLDNPFAPLPAKPKKKWSLGVDPLETEEHTFCGCDKCVFYSYSLIRDHAEPHPLAHCLDGFLPISASNSYF